MISLQPDGSLVIVDHDKGSFYGTVSAAHALELAHAILAAREFQHKPDAPAP